MRILLITTGGNLNPGDQFIRLGVERLVRSVRPDVEFIRVDKESEDIAAPVEFDKAILCGMPLWWDNPVSQCREIGWWGPLMRGWISEKKENFLILGAGSVTGQHEFNASRFLSAVEESIERAFVVVTRQPVIDHPKLISSVCPAAFSVDWHPDGRFRRVCNLMPAGAHDAHLNPVEAQNWMDRLPDVAERLRSDGFEFCAHSPDEVELAKSLGWEHPLFFDTPEEYLHLYNHTAYYAGNRLHAAVVVAAGGGLAAVQGYDSRMEMVKPFTPRVFFPTEISEPSISVVYSTPDHLQTLLAREWRRQRRVVESFLLA